MMTLTLCSQWRAAAALAEAGAYDPAHEHDACGVGLVVQIDGTARRLIVEKAIAALKSVWHRGAVDPDGKTGDGAGIRIGVAQDFFRAHIEASGHELADASICVGQIFLPRRDLLAQEAARAIVESEILRAGFYIYGWRQTPVNSEVIGARAEETRPEIEQVLCHDTQGRAEQEIERALYICRRRIERRVREAFLPDFYICSFSAQSLVYKGMFLAEHIDEFYTDLRDERFISSFAVYHQRYSTNTFPQWRLAQPFRVLAHNGEINTLRGNINWMKSHEINMQASMFGDDADALLPVIPQGASDSAALDAAFELLVRAGRDVPSAKTLLIPDSWSKRTNTMPMAHAALYACSNAIIEPWDGPAAIAAFDGRWAVAGLDRNGLRPMRYSITEGGILAVGSETGMCPLDTDSIIERGHVGPGGMIAVDIVEGKLYSHEEIIDALAARKPYQQLQQNTIRELDKELEQAPEQDEMSPELLLRQQYAAGYTFEDMELILAPMIEDGKEATGSMGDDSPLAVLADRYRPLSHYFRQNFAQVTNPPIDPLRENVVMSLKTRFGNMGDILQQNSMEKALLTLESPVLTTGMYLRLREILGNEATRIDCLFRLETEQDNDGSALRRALDRICTAAGEAVKAGCKHIVLTDENSDVDNVAIPMILAVGAVHSYLVGKGLRAPCSLIVRSAECLDTHYFAVLIGVGATCVNAWLANACIHDRIRRGLPATMSVETALQSYKSAIEAGLLKIMSKMGISVISSYRGGYNFEALGLSRALVDAFFPGMTSRISGIGLAGLQVRAVEQHRQAWRQETNILPIGGFYRLRSLGGRHTLTGELIHSLQQACDNGNYAQYCNYARAVHQGRPVQLRELLDFRSPRQAIPLEQVQSVNELRKRFVTPGMSLGALSPEAHGTLNIAMNRIGAKSVSGEGGEDRDRYQPHANGDNENSAVKQVASGRFGVTAEYLNQCREIEIKIAQGAKPGEGGQLPGFKVTKLIARNRHSTPGVTLISPPPHHDIYSIEDLAQLIYDLKQINPEARVCVKLVSCSGVGTIAAGVAKAKADAILISGHCGGTGASPQTSIKYCGLPWEIGLAEAHQLLTLNNMRDQVTLRVDGGIKTGRDIVIAAMLGAEEYGIGTASLLALGCLMVRQCHSNTCPVGICTQNEKLRRKFTGSPEKIVRLMSFLAEDVREILAGLGFACLDEVVGRTDLLAQVYRGSPTLDDLDLNPLLVRADATHMVKYRPSHRNEVPASLDEEILKDAAAFFDRAEKMHLDYRVANTHRAIGARASSVIVRKMGQDKVPEGRLWVTLSGSAGQSLGAFGVRGLTLEVIGDANDYVGKGLSGATIILYPPSTTRYAAHENAILGNTALYGAVSGKLFAAGRAGERFAVRNSGACAVIEGCGANGCEYMTGGKVVILGDTGTNFGAGMTGGMAFVHDPENRLSDRINPDSILLLPMDSGHWQQELKNMIEEHTYRSGSEKGASILADWDNEVSRFVHVAPKEIVDKLESMEGAA